MTDQPEKKIIIDEDWKAQVEREREELSQTQDSTPEATDSSQSAPADEGFDTSQLPPASFNILVSTMATQAMAAMGQLPEPMTGQAEANLPFAKYHIDLLAVLQQKTAGNLSQEEAAMLEEALHQLRMMYVHLEAAP